MKPTKEWLLAKLQASKDLGEVEQAELLYSALKNLEALDTQADRLKKDMSEEQARHRSELNKFAFRHQVLQDLCPHEELDEKGTCARCQLPTAINSLGPHVSENYARVVETVVLQGSFDHDTGLPIAGGYPSPS